MENINQEEGNSQNDQIISKAAWTPDEDIVLIQLIEKIGAQKWTMISEYLPNRIGKQCRERWHNHLNPKIKKCNWSI